MVAIFAKNVGASEAVIHAMTPQFADPDGAINVASLRADLAFFKSVGAVTSADIAAETIVDGSFAAAAAKELGPYRPKD